MDEKRVNDLIRSAEIHPAVSLEHGEMVMVTIGGSYVSMTIELDGDMPRLVVMIDPTDSLEELRNKDGNVPVQVELNGVPVFVR